MPDSQQYVIKTDGGDFRIFADKDMPQDQVLALAAKSNPDFAKYHAQAVSSTAGRDISKATGIGPAPSVLERLRAGQVPGLDELQKGLESVGTGKGLTPQETILGKAGQLAGVLTKNPASQALFGATSPTPGIPPGVTQEWQAINEAIGATKTAVRIPKSATSLEEAITMPARGLEKEGFNSGTLSKMSPMEQQTAIAPKWNAAGQAVDRMVGQATANKVIVDPSKSAIPLVRSIPNPKLQDKTVRELSDLMREVGIIDASNATPTQVMNLRRALQSGARFGPNGDLSSLGGIRARLYSAITGDLHGAVDGLQEVDQHYSDLNSAMKAINNSASKEAVKAPHTILEQLMPVAKAMAQGAGISAGAGTLYGIWKALSAKEKP